MTTSLEQQLKKLALPQTSLLQHDKKRASLLFDPKEAAGFNQDTFYDIGISGLKELIKLNVEFAAFENSLFSITSRQIQRAVEDKGVNIKLNKNIRRFLLLLSPYFLLKAAHKVLEWLIYRFSIHDYNKEELLKLILPYHETNIFVRVLQILNIRSENDHWHWLHPLRKHGIHLPKLTLFNHAANDTGFLKFISDMVLQAIKENGAKANTLTTLFSFYCTTIIGVLDHSPEVKEQQITVIMPTLLKGMSSDIPDFAATSYMIIAKLLTKCKLSPKLLNQFVTKLSYRQIHLRMEATLLLTLIYQLQEEVYNKVSENALKNLTNNEWIVSNLAKLTSNGIYILPFLMPVFKALLENIEQEDHKKFFDSLISGLKFSNDDADKLIRSILDYSPSIDSTDQTTAQWCSDLFKRIELQYPDPFDKVIHEVMSGKNSDKHQQALSSYLNFAISCSQNQNNVFEKLYHPNPHVRENAVTFLVKNFPSLNEKEKNVFKNAITERLLDDSKAIVKTLLTLKPKYLSQLLGKENSIDFLINILNLCQKKYWYDVSMSVITLICCVKAGNDIKVFLAILPFMFPTNNDEFIVALHVLKSAYADECTVLKSVKSKVPKEITPESFCNSVYRTLCENNNLPDISDLLDALDDNKKHAIHKYMSVVIITCAVPKLCHPALGIKILKSIFTYINSVSVKTLQDENIKYPVHKSCIISAKNGDVPLQGILSCISILIEKVVDISFNGLWFNFTEPDDTLTFIVSMFSFLLDGCANGKDDRFYSEILDQFFKRYFHSTRDKICFFANILVAENSENLPITSKTQLRSVRILKSILENTDESICWSLDLNSKIFVPSILISLGSPVYEIRKMALEVLNRIINSVVLQTDDTYIPLLHELANRQSEILLDNQQILLILFAIFEQNNESYKEIFNTLVEIATDYNTPVHISSKIITILTIVNSYEKFETFANHAYRILKYIGNNEKIIDGHHSTIIYNSVLRLNETVSKDITIESSALKFLLEAFKYDIVSLEYMKNKFGCPSVLMLEQINRKIFANLKCEVQSKLIKSFCEIVTNVENPEVTSAINRVIKEIDLDAKLLVDILVAMRDAKTNKMVTTYRKRRTSLIPTSDILDTKEWIQGVSLLEFIQNKKKIVNTETLVPVLFEVLKKCLDFDEQAAVEYPKQLILSSILHCCIKMENKTVSESLFNMELVVQCVRASPNPQTHHHALLLLAHTASLIPQQVLHNIMAIFTFMGSSVLRHDDAYSFQIISKIIETVIPILITGDETNIEIKERVANVLRVFVDVILDIPEHRRMSLFTKLLTTLGVEHYLWIFLLLVFEAHVLHGNEKQKFPNKEAPNEKVFPRLDVTADITLEYMPDVIMKSIINVLEFLKKLPAEKENVKKTDFSILNIEIYTHKQFRHYKYTIITFLSRILTSKPLVNKIAMMNSKETLQMEELYKNMIIQILTYIQAVSKITESSVGSPQAQYWKVMLHHCYDILDSINALLTKEMFLLVIRGLVVHNIPTVKRRALELLNAKLQHQPTFFYKDTAETDITDFEDVFALLPSLVDIVKTVTKDNNEPELELIQQTALLTLKLLVKLLAEKNQEKFVSLLEFITELIRTNKAQGTILASVILCLAELVSSLRAYAIPSLTKFMPAIIKILKIQKYQEVPNLLFMCTITAVQKIVESLPLFLSPYLDKLLRELSVLSCTWEDTEYIQKTVPFEVKLAAIRSNIGTKVPSRILIPIITQTYNKLLKSKQYKAVGPLMNVLSESLSNVFGQELVALLPDLTSYFLTALEFRNANSDAVELDQINMVEDEVINALTVLILKLSESSFRPLYYRLYDWAVRCDSRNERVITFYRLSASIAEKLKGLFTLFAGHFIKNAASLLDECNVNKSKKLYFEEEAKCLLLIENIVKTLTSIFTYDSQNFIDKDRFEVLMQPLVDQLENRIDFANLSERTSSLIIPCIAQFAISTGDDALWKQLNYQILLKTRHELPTIRLIGLECVSAVACKINEDFLPLLPETIPFLAELLEDEDENVETSCQKAIQELEKVLGEPLQKYF